VAFDLRVWLPGMLSLVCVDSRQQSLADWSPFRRLIFTDVYPELLRTGLPILPNIALDLAWLYYLGTTAKFVVPQELVACQNVGGYVDFLNGIGRQPFLHRAAFRAETWIQSRRAALPFRSSRFAPTPPQSTEVYRLFLQVAGAHGPFVGDQQFWRDLQNAWIVPNLDAALANKPTARRDPGGAQLMRDYLSGFKEEAFPLRSSLEMVLLAPLRTSAASTLDLPLLEECLRYSPLRDCSDTEVRRRAIARLPAREVTTARSPETGNWGITKDSKNPISTILRTELAREDFEERYHLGNLLFHERYAPRLEARRALLVWVVNQGWDMREVPSGRSRSLASTALGLAAMLLEDSVRWIGHAQGLDLGALIVTHDAENQTRGRVHEVALSEWSVIPTEQDSNAWIPSLASFFPYYFHNEPLWLENSPFPPTRTAKLPWERSIELVRNLGASNALSSSKGGGGPFDLIQVAVIEPDVPEHEQPGEGVLSRWQHALEGASNAAVVHMLNVSNDRIRARSSARVTSRDAGLQPEYKGDLMELRQDFRRELTTHLVV
jgi:hypothetical protein